MKDRIFGNGSGKGLVHRVPLAPGWVIYRAGDPPPSPENLPLALNNHLITDLTEHPQVRVRTVLPIVQDGNTIAIHLWYEDLALAPREKGGS